MDSRALSIQQLKEIHNKLQNLNTNVSNAIGSSIEFQSKLEGKVQESLYKLQQNLDQSINTDRVKQNENILKDVHTQFQQKCSYVEDQNYNLVMRLHQMEKQEQEYKNQIDNLNNQLKQKGLIWNYESYKYNSSPINFSFKYNKDDQQGQQEGKKQLEEFTTEQLDESLQIRNEIKKLKSEIDFLLQEKKNIIYQQEKIFQENNLEENKQQYLQDYLNPSFNQLKQDDILTNSKKSSKSNQNEFVNYELNDLQNLQRIGSREIIQEIQNIRDKTQETQVYKSVKEDNIQQTCQFSPFQCNDPKTENLQQTPFPYRTENILFDELQNISQEQNFNNSSPKYVELIESMSVKGFQQNKQDSIIEQENIQQIKLEIEKSLKNAYEQKLQIANQELQNQLSLQQKQTDELLQEREARINMQIKLQELESKLRQQNLNPQFDRFKQTDINNSSSDKYQNPITTSDSFSSPYQQTLSTTPQRIKDEVNSINHFTSQKQNSSNYTPIQYESPSQQQFKINQNSLEGSSSKFQPIHSLLTLNKVNSQDNKAKYNYQMSILPNITTDIQNNLSNSNSIIRSNTDKQNIEQKVIDIISKLQLSMCSSKKKLSTSQESKKMIETAKKFECAIEEKLSKMKSILSERQLNNSNSQNISNSKQIYPEYNGQLVYTSDFNS